MNKIRFRLHVTWFRVAVALSVAGVSASIWLLHRGVRPRWALLPGRLGIAALGADDQKIRTS